MSTNPGKAACGSTEMSKYIAGQIRRIVYSHIVVGIHNPTGLLLYEIAGAGLYVIHTVLGMSYQRFHPESRVELCVSVSADKFEILLNYDQF